MVRINVLFVKSLIRDYVKSKGFHIKSGVLDGTVLNDAISTILDNAVDKAKKDNRNFIDEQDIKDYLREVNLVFTQKPEKKGIVRIRAKIENITDQALLLFFEDGKKIWIPKSTIENVYNTKNEDFQEFQIDMWFKGTPQMREKFIKLLKRVDKLPENKRYSTFSNLLEAIKKTEVFNLHYPLIKKKFSSLFNGLDKIPYMRRLKPFTNLVDAAKETDLMGENFESLLKTIPKFADDYWNHFQKWRNYDHAAFFYLINAIKETDLMIEKFTLILNMHEEFPVNYPVKKRYRLFLDLINTIKGTCAFNKHFSLIETKLINSLDELMLESESHVHPELPKYYVFCGLFDVLKGTEAMTKHYPYIQTKFTELLNGVVDLGGENKFYAFVSLFSAIKGTSMMIDHRIKTTYNTLRKLREEFSEINSWGTDLLDLVDKYFKNNSNFFNHIKFEDEDEDMDFYSLFHRLYTH